MLLRRVALPFVLLVVLISHGSTAVAGPRWSEAQAREWYARQGFLVGANYVPATAINQLEMWQADTFDPARIDLELGWAEAIGMNTMRVFLHDLAYQQDPQGFLRPRRSVPGASPQKHRIRPMLVLFDSVWDPFPAVGPAAAAAARRAQLRLGAESRQGGARGSGALASPRDVRDGRRRPLQGRCAGAGVGPVERGRQHQRAGVLRASSRRTRASSCSRCCRRSSRGRATRGPTQPLTSGLWRGGDWSKLTDLPAIDRVQLALSDVITFHSYDPPPQLEARIQQLQGYNRPIICTEYMARGNGSTFEGALPVLKKHDVGAINWGLVAGQGADAPALGLLAAALRGSRAGGLVPRGLPQRRHAVQRRRRR